jgi:hypothetical protein
VEPLPQSQQEPVPTERGGGIRIGASRRPVRERQLFRIARADWSQGRRFQALGSWGSGEQGRVGQWVKGGANRISL